jgi:hypothetical protein
VADLRGATTMPVVTSLTIGFIYHRAFKALSVSEIGEPRTIGAATSKRAFAGALEIFQRL